jgi:hypothetical protein
MSAQIVIPSEVEGSRHETFKVTQRDPSVRAGLADLLGMTLEIRSAPSARRCALFLRNNRVTEICGFHQAAGPR